MELRSATRTALVADLEGNGALADYLEVRVPGNWPPDLYDVPAIQWTIDRITAGQPEQFLLYYWVLLQESEPETLVGLGGYKGPPNEGSIEIGYSVLAQYRRQGLATEAVQALVDFAFQDPEVKQVTAETFPALVASIGVLEKCGFELIGPGAEEGVIRFARSRDGIA